MVQFVWVMLECLHVVFMVRVAVNIVEHGGGQRHGAETFRHIFIVFKCSVFIYKIYWCSVSCGASGLARTFLLD